MRNNISTIIILAYSSNRRFIFSIELLLTNIIIDSNNLLSSIIYRCVAIVLRRKRSNIDININILFSCFLYYFAKQYCKYNCFESQFYLLQLFLILVAPKSVLIQNLDKENNFRLLIYKSQYYTIILYEKRQERKYY